MELGIFSHKSVSQRLSKKLQDWYGVTTTINHFEDSSTIEVNGLLFMVSRCKQFDKTNGQFTLTYNGKLIECTQMYVLVKQSRKS